MGYVQPTTIPAAEARKTGWLSVDSRTPVDNWSDKELSANEGHGAKFRA
jgi:hypothetical protein